MAWLAPVVVAGVVGAAVISYDRNDEVQAAAGSPYYGKAVQEAIAGLKTAGEKAAPATRPPLAAGLSPDDYYWCENCKTYHKREPGQPAAVAQAPAAAQQPGDAIPPLPEGLSANDYYWCVNCKTYHPRDAARTTPPAGWAGVPYKLPSQ